MGQYNNFTAAQLAASFVKLLKLTPADAASRVEFNITELELDPNNITTKQAAEIERCIVADIKAGK